MQDNTNDNNVYSDNEPIDNQDENITQEAPEETPQETEPEDVIVQDDLENDDIDGSCIENQEFYEEEYFDEEIADEKLINKINEKVKKTFFIFDRIPPGKRMKAISLMVLCLILILLIFTDIIPILPNAYNRFYIGNTYSIGETQGGVFDKFGENVLYAGNGKILSFGPDMSCNFTVDTPAGKPLIETDGNNALVYYENTDDAFVVMGNNSVKSLNYKETITGGSVSKSGYYAIISDESGYKSCVEVFNKNGTSIYKWHTNSHIIDVSVSNDGKNMACAGYEINSSSVSGKLVFFDLTSDKPLKEITLNSCMVSEVKYIAGNTFAAFGDMYTAAYSSLGSLLWRIDYKGRVPKCYDVSQNGDIAFVFDRFSSSLSDSTVELYSKNGDFMGKYDSRENVKHISANNGYFLLSLDRQTVLLDDDADVVKIKNSSKDFKNAILYSNYNFAFSISDGIAEVMSVKH